MEIRARIPLVLLDRKLRRFLEDDPETREAVDPRGSALVLAATSPLMEKVMREGEARGGLRITPFLLSRTEDLKKCSAVRLLPSRSLRESASDNESNRQYLETRPWARTLDGHSTRYLDQATYSGRVARGGSFATLDQWTNTFILSEVAASTLSRSGLLGWRLGPVAGTRVSNPRGDLFVLVVERAMRRCLAEAGTLVTSDAASGATTVRWFVAPVYDNLDSLREADLVRSAEAENLHGFPITLGSKRFLDWYLDSGLKGLRFDPVLLQGSLEHDQQRREWHQLEGLLRRFPQSSLW